MHNEIILRTAALQLQTIDHREVVKVAGLVRRLKNWFKKRQDPDYRQAVETLQQDSLNIKDTISVLYQELGKLQEAIKDGEIDEYNTSLNNVKELTAKLWSEVKTTTNDSKDYYTLQEMESPGFQEWFKKFLPKEYDLQFGTIYNIPMKETKWYANLDSNQITLPAGSKNYLINRIKETLVRDSFADPKEAASYFANESQFINNFQNAVANGVLISANVKNPSEKIPRPMAGTTEIQVTTAPFNVGPNKVQAKVNLIDLSTSKSSRNKMSLGKTHHVVILGNPVSKAASRIEELKKLALSNQQVAYKSTPLSDTDLANVLRAGYQQVFGSDPTAEVLANGWAQVAFETGRGSKIYNNNFGNIKATDDWIKSGQPFAVKETSEFTGSGKHYTDLAKWKAYPSPEAGAAGYWKLIGNRYKKAMDWMEAGDPQSATVALAMNKYFTANIGKYAKGVSSLYNTFMSKIAPTLPGLKSAPRQPPGEKPSLKPWYGDYSKAEKEAILRGGKTEPVNVPSATTDVPLQDVDALINTLYASEVGPMEKFVKNAILEEILPASKVIIVVNSDASYIDKSEYARVTSFVLRKFIDATVSIHTDGKNIEIQCSVLGTPLTVTGAVQALCDCVSDAMELSNNIKVEGMAVPGFVSKYSEMELNEIYKNHRMFNLNILEK